MSWQLAVGLIVAGAVGTAAAVTVAAVAGCWALAESEARMSDESADWIRGLPHVGSER